MWPLVICSIGGAERRAAGLAGVIDSTINLVRYAGNGSTVTPYVIPFRLDDPDWLVVQRAAADGTVTILEVGIDFELAGDGEAAEASMTTMVAIPNTATLTIARFAPATWLSPASISSPPKPCSLSR